MKTEWRKGAWILRQKDGRVAANDFYGGKGLPALYPTRADATKDIFTKGTPESVEIIIRSTGATK